MNALQRPCSLWWVRWRAFPPGVECPGTTTVHYQSRTGGGLRVWAVGSKEAEQQLKDLLKQLGYTVIRVNCTGIFNLAINRIHKKIPIDKKSKKS